MRLPKDLLSGNYTKPNLFLCETDKTRIGKLETTETSASLKFNAYSELSFTIGRTYADMITGQQKVNPFYNKIEALRLVYLEGFGYFEIQDPEIVSDGIQEVKNVTAYSLEYNLSQKYIEELHVNTGETNSVEVIYAEENNLGGVSPVTLYNPVEKELSLLHLALEKIYGWSVGHVDASLTTMSRTFEISKSSVYDFITQEICEKFNCFVVFDTINNTINLYAESLITKFIGDGKTTQFVVTSKYDSISSVSINSYKTTQYSYDPKTGVIIFFEPPEAGAKIEVVDGSQEQWITDVYVTFDNLAQEVNISYSADDIKTVLTVKGSDDFDIREVNFGLPYITDLSYYYSVDWMGQELYDAYTEYLKNNTEKVNEYSKNEEKLLELYDRILYETNRVSLKYSVASVTSTTTGKYYVRGGTEPYYYTEVSLPDDYNVYTTYYTLYGSNLNEDKFKNLYDALQTYYMSGDGKDTSALNELAEDFSFLETYTISNLVTDLSNASTVEEKDAAVRTLLDDLWEQLGLSILNNYYKTYENIRMLYIEQGYNKIDSEEYWRYYPVTIVVSSLYEKNEDGTETGAISIRKSTINAYNKEYDNISSYNQKIARNMLIDVFFVNYYTSQGIGVSRVNDITENTRGRYYVIKNEAIGDYYDCDQVGDSYYVEVSLPKEYDASKLYYDLSGSKSKAERLLVRLSPFLREDEYTDSNFAETNTDTTETIMQLKKELLESGRIELSKLSDPKLDFSMTMANIYALNEFAPIVDQFQLGNLINVELRKDYVKRARLLQVDINFDDFSDFSCEFGQLTNLKTPSSIHADLLSQALSAGKSVASNISYWNKGADLATSTDLKIQQGLIGAVNGIYTSDQSVVMDDNGILLRKVEDGDFSPNQIWLRNNTILLSNDGFKTAHTGIGEFYIDGEAMYGILASAIMSGYVESSKIVGGTINIGEGTFVVDSFGNVTMNAASIKGYVENDGVISSINQSPEEIAIEANRISLVGKEIDLTSDNITINSTNFTVDKDGNITAKNADIEGKITASTGEVGGWTIDTNSISGLNGNYKALISKSAIGLADNVVFGVYDGSKWSCYMDGVGKLYASNADIAGTINATSGNIGGCAINNGQLSIDAAYINSGTFNTARIPDLNADKITAGTIHVDRIPSFSADKITSGTINAGVVSVINLNASNITAGTMSADRINGGTIDASKVTVTNLNAEKITVGTLSADRIPNISASKITSGTISTDRLSASVITTGNFSSKTLTTGNLTVTNGGSIGVWTVNSYNYLYAISGNYGVSLSPTSVSHGQGGSTTWVNIVKAGQNASDERLKTNITEFDDKFDKIFDSLKPIQFEYSKDILGAGIRFGYIAQDIIQSFEDVGENIEDYSFVYKTEIEDNSTEQYYQFNQGNFISLNTWQIQKLKARVEELENKLAALET